MKTRMTLTAVALGTLILTGCETAGGGATMSKPEAAPTVTAPIAEGKADKAMAKDAMVDNTAVNPESIVTTSPVTQANDKTLVMNKPDSVDQTTPDTGHNMADKPAANPESVVVTSPTNQADDKEMAMNDEDAKMTESDAAMNACFAAGGQIVGWVGDPTGAEQACRREDGLEYRLADAQYYQ